MQKHWQKGVNRHTSTCWYKSPVFWPDWNLHVVGLKGGKQENMTQGKNEQEERPTGNSTSTMLGQRFEPSHIFRRLLFSLLHHVHPFSSWTISARLVFQLHGLYSVMLLRYSISCELWNSNLNQRFMCFAAVNHLSGPLGKQKLTSAGSKVTSVSCD